MRVAVLQHKEVIIFFFAAGGSALRYYNSIGEKQGCIIVKFNYP